MTYEEINEQQQQKVDALLKECRVFFAFSNKQFEENKTPLEDGEKYLRLPAGGFVPKNSANNLLTGLEDLKKWKKETIKRQKLEEKAIIYELYNHECFYTNDCTPVIDLFPDKEELIYKLFYNEKVNTYQS